MYHSATLEVMIASPSDLTTARSKISNAVHDWNAHESRAHHVVLLPVMWETHSWPQAGGHPQQILNRQLADGADILVAVLWTRLGTATPGAPSGTVEEVDRFLAAGKPVLLYFINMPVAPNSVDAKQLRAVRSYQRKVQKASYYFQVDSEDELQRSVRDHLSRTVRSMIETARVPRAPDDQRDPSPGPPPPPQPTTSPTDTVSGQGPRAELIPYQRRLAGWVATWKTTLDAMEGDFSVAQRHGLMNEVYLVVLDIIRSVAVIDDHVPILDRLRPVAVDAGQFRTMQVYLDGGVSFGRLSDGCRAVVAALDVIAQDVWE